MNPEPQPEHRWLHRVVGEWTYEAECVMGPGQEPTRARGTESVRSIGGLWVIGEGQGEMPGLGPATMIITLGFDPRRKRFVGTFVGSMMTHLFIYDGALDADGKTLILEAEGPDCGNEGRMTRYQDVVELHSDDHRVVTSRMLGEDGEWRQIMTAQFRRTR